MIFGILMAHSGWRYIIFLLLVLVIVKSLIGMVSNGRWGGMDEWLNRLTPIAVDIQVLLGLVLWILQQRWTGVEATASWEHPVTMVVATALAHVTSTRVRRAPADAAKFQTATIGYIIAGLVVTLGVLRITEVL